MGRQGNSLQLGVYLTVVAALAWGCAPSEVQEASALSGSSGTTGNLTLTAPNTSLSFNQSVTAVATGGTAPYTYSAESATGGNLGTMNPQTGLYTAPPVNESVTLAVEDATGLWGYLTVSIGTGSTTSPTNSLTLSPASYTMNVGGSVTFYASGGSGNYTFTLEGPGELQADSYFATAAGTATITAMDEDNTSLIGTATVIVSGSGTTSGGLEVSPANPSVIAGQSVVLTPSGGTPPYAFGIVEGAGTFSVTQVQSGGTTTFMSPGDTTGQIELSLSDSANPPNITDFYVTLTTGGGTTGPVSASWTMQIADYVALTYDNTGDYPAGSGYTSDTPMFWIWGSSSAWSASGVGANGSTANYIPLTNYSNAAMSPTTYRGYFTVGGPTATTTINFCIPPATSGNSMAAYISQSGGPSGGFPSQAERFDAAGDYIANGQLLDAFFVQVNSIGSTGSSSVAFYGEFTGNTSCSDFNQGMYIEVL